MAPEPRAEIELAPEEHLLFSWPAELVHDRTAKGGMGQLILTDQRCLFYRRAGLWGGRRLEPNPTFSVALGSIRSITIRMFSMTIGYGDRLPIPGVEIDGTVFRLNRENSAEHVLASIALARTRESGPSAHRPG
jgi:hypothetical protein